MKYAVCNEMFENWPWERVCAFAHELGYHGVEVAPFTVKPHAALITPAERAFLRRSAERMELEIIGLHWLLANVASDRQLYVTHPDRSIREDTAEYFVELTRLCADLGGHVMVIGSPKARNLLPGVSREDAMRYAAEVFTPSLDLAAKN